MVWLNLAVMLVTIKVNARVKAVTSRYVRPRSTQTAQTTSGLPLPVLK